MIEWSKPVLRGICCKKFFLRLTACLLLSVCLTSCRHNSAKASNECNGIYYWRTTFSTNEYEKEFMKKHNIKKLYIKFFDVDKDWEAKKGDKIVPVATIQFTDSINRGIEIVPTVYITQSAIEAMQLKEDEYAEKILRRINAMCLQNGIQFKELQLDCDWTKHTRKFFYRLCEEIKQRLDSTQTLSSTIRLHQLIQDPPPVDKGVLMVYNTGNIREISTNNSIFSCKDIEPYLRDSRLEKYPLPLDVAYPAYGWSLVFYPKDGKFERIMRRTDLSAYPGLKKMGPNMYEATEDVDFSSNEENYDKVYKGRRIKVERPSAQEILEVKKLIDQKLANKPHNNILYHLDESQLSHYSDNEINKIYSRN